MRKVKEKRKIRVEVEFTEGYQERFTREILKIYEKRLKKESEEIDREEVYSGIPQHQEVRVS